MTYFIDYILFMILFLYKEKTFQWKDRSETASFNNK